MINESTFSVPTRIDDICRPAAEASGGAEGRAAPAPALGAACMATPAVVRMEGSGDDRAASGSILSSQPPSTQSNTSVIAQPVAGEFAISGAAAATVDSGESSSNSNRNAPATSAALSEAPS
ncbi:hypothetical protein EZI54_11460 [Marinobacter halodurans]|uniref:Uncharacterized protein n=1 Tax=Marinobacter halodurans TaxID=2528979 RepID=A0ABY1ZK43_9GAMM|nr:hypothetical protein [Marinobacter halodurans]TBW55437.1 hypothetical protein EZI54_11460 [Marinobacter halodurans]